ncbi:MAG: hypothetical protein JWR50_2929 [Mucilaginibacter sp.]|nr:hypothetical protein [Mucilaginibacter sp.]
MTHGEWFKNYKIQSSYKQTFITFLAINLLTYALLHFVSPVFHKKLTIK